MKNRILFVDKLSLISFLVIIYHSITNKNLKIYLLESKDQTISCIIKKILKIVSIELNYPKKHSMEMFCDDGTPSCYKAVSLVTDACLFYSKKIIDESTTLTRINEELGGEIIKLHLARKYYFEILNLFFKFFYCEALLKCSNHQSSIYYSHENLSINEFLKTYSNIRFVNLSYFIFLDFFMNKVHLIYKRITSNFFLNFKKVNYSFNSKTESKNLMILQEDDISNSKCLRNCPFFFPLIKNNLNRRIFIKRSKIWNTNYTNEHKDLNINIFSDYCEGVKKQNTNEFNQLMLKLINLVFIERLFCKYNLRKNLEYIIKLLRNSINLNNFVVHNNIMTFLSLDHYTRDSDTASILSYFKIIQTVSVQYSNIRLISIMMLNLSDKMYIFSPFYERYFIKNNIKPRLFIHVGYLFDCYFNFIREPAQIIRNQIEKNGDKIIISYFNENPQPGIFNLHGIDHEKKILDVLLNFIQKNSQYALIFKSQFSKNNFSFIKDLGYDELLKSERVYFLYTEGHRNNHLPAEAALASDFSIGECYGATASLESALVGCKSLIIKNKKATIHLINESYDKSILGTVIFNDMKEVLNAIDKFPNDKRIGCWKSIFQELEMENDVPGCAKIYNSIF